MVGGIYYGTMVGVRVTNTKVIVVLIAILYLVVYTQML